jgi:hypothetical protein
MPNIPKYGAAGQVPFTAKPEVGPHEESTVDPPHGADNGYDVPFMWGAKFRDPELWSVPDTKFPALPPS